jgi:hypothetical protein
MKAERPEPVQQTRVETQLMAKSGGASVICRGTAQLLKRKVTF